jgi:guanylate kinase
MNSSQILRQFSTTYSKRMFPPLVLCGPSGAGKSTMTNILLSNYNNNFKFCVSSTTRKPREGEENGVHYFFHTKEEFEEVSNKIFLINKTLQEVRRG